MQNRNKMQVAKFLVGMHMYFTLFMQHITWVSSAAAVACTCGYLTAEKSRYPPLRLLSHPRFPVSHASYNFSGQYWPQDRVFNNSGRKICTSFLLSDFLYLYEIQITGFIDQKGRCVVWYVLLGNKALLQLLVLCKDLQSFTNEQFKKL